MARLLYSAITSLDGYVADATGNFDWAAPDEEVHAFANELERPIGTSLYGRKMYEVMSAWENMPIEGEPNVIRDFAEIWRAADKIVFSRTLPLVSTARTRLERAFDAELIRQLKFGAGRDLSIAGPGLAAHAIRAGLVDEYHLFLTPIVVGGGNPWLPGDVAVNLDLLDQRRFGSGVVYLRYAARP